MLQSFHAGLIVLEETLEDPLERNLRDGGRHVWNGLRRKSRLSEKEKQEGPRARPSENEGRGPKSSHTHPTPVVSRLALLWPAVRFMVPARQKKVPAQTAIRVDVWSGIEALAADALCGCEMCDLLVRPMRDV